MAMINKQRVNFLEVLPVRYDLLPGLNHMLMIWGALCVILYFQHLYADSAHSKLLSHGDQLSSQLNEGLAALSKKSEGNNEGGGKGRLVAIADDGLNFSKTGFYRDLHSLSLNYNNKVWFTYISINNEDDTVTLLGKTSSTSALNELFTKLTLLDEFKSYKLNLRDIARVDSNANSDTVFHGFVISNDNDLKYNKRGR